MHMRHLSEGFSMRYGGPCVAPLKLPGNYTLSVYSGVTSVCFSWRFLIEFKQFMTLQNITKQLAFDPVYQMRIAWHHTAAVIPLECVYR